MENLNETRDNQLRIRNAAGIPYRDGIATAVAVCDGGGAVRMVMENEIKQFGEYRTSRLVLEAWDKLEG
jgi:hypothetical protein